MDQIRIVKRKKELIKVLLDDTGVTLFDKHKDDWIIGIYASGQMYVKRYGLNIRSSKNNWVMMHRELMNFPELHVDHINGNTLDNRLSNLRVATQTQNNQNTKKRKNSKCKYKGVCKITHYKNRIAYRAIIHVNKKRIPLGIYDTEVQAAMAYDEAARKYFREFARLNFDNAHDYYII